MTALSIRWSQAVRPLLIAACLGGATGSSASAQTAPDVAAIPPVEITADVANGEIRCRPQRARLPAERLLNLRVANRTARPITFVAPKFFAEARHIESEGFAYDVVTGGFVAAPNATVRVVLRSPPADEYLFSCFDPSRAPTPASSGFLVVVPAAARP